MDSSMRDLCYVTGSSSKQKTKRAASWFGHLIRRMDVMGASGCQRSSGLKPRHPIPAPRPEQHKCTNRRAYRAEWRQ